MVVQALASVNLPRGPVTLTRTWDSGRSEQRGRSVAMWLEELVSNRSKQLSGALHTYSMDNPSAAQSGDAQHDPVEGQVRFGSGGLLELFDGTQWTPLERVSDIEGSPVFRGLPPQEPDSPGSAVP